MMKVICTSSKEFAKPKGDLQYVLFGRAQLKGMGSAGPTMQDLVKKFKIFPHNRTWDFLAIALAVVAADDGLTREKSPDGWTREIDLLVSVQDGAFWTQQTSLLEQLLRFLTGDVWKIRFQGDGVGPIHVPTMDLRKSEEDCVALLSGGADSLTGAIDLVTSGKKPLFVSQVADGDKTHQREFADAIAGAGHHLQLNHNIDSPVKTERSQRSRSLIFIAYGIIAAATLPIYAEGKTVDLIIPENGFISLNIPLTPLRRGSLSTRTTHPQYLKLLQQLFEVMGLRVRLRNPYQLKTKGELFKECKNQALLKKLICESTSCGRFARMNFKHCGRCVPCLIRRAAIHAYGIEDKTHYVYANLGKNDADHRRFDDVQSASYAVEFVKLKGIRKWIGGALLTTQVDNISTYEALLQRGIDELSAFLQDAGAL